MEKPNLTRLIDSFLLQGFSVAYVDGDSQRRKYIEDWAALSWPDSVLAIEAPVLSGRASPHYNVLITVNESDFDPIVARELRFVPDSSRGKSWCVVKVAL